MEQFNEIAFTFNGTIAFMNGPLGLCFYLVSSCRRVPWSRTNGLKMNFLFRGLGIRNSSVSLKAAADADTVDAAADAVDAAADSDAVDAAAADAVDEVGTTLRTALLLLGS